MVVELTIGSNSNLATCVGTEYGLGSVRSLAVLGELIALSEGGLARCVRATKVLAADSTHVGRRVA